MAFFAQQKEDGQLPASSSSPKAAPPPATARSRWSSPSPQPPGTSSSSPTTRNSSRPPTNPAPAGTPGSASIATPARPASARASAPTTPAWTTPPLEGHPRQCPGADARKCPPDPHHAAPLPRPLRHGLRRPIALAAMAKTLGKRDDKPAGSPTPSTSASSSSPSSTAPKMPPSTTSTPRTTSSASAPSSLLRVLGEHVVDPHKDKAIFDAIWTKQVHNPQAFWAPYPFPSSALNEPTFVRPSRATVGAGQPGPHRPARAALDDLLRQAGRADPRDAAVVHGHHAPRRVPPADGPPHRRVTQPDPGGYSPSALVFLDYARRLSKG